MSRSNQEFQGKVVLITGASSGLGACTAIHLSTLGASLTLTGRNLVRLQKVAEQCIQPNIPKPLTIQADLINEEDVKRIISTTIQHYKKLDVLVNNAGVFEPSTIHNGTLEQFDKIFHTNVRGTFQLTQLAVPYLIATKGNIVNVSGVAGMRAFPAILIACMGKAALDQFTRCVAMDLAEKQVRVNSVNPGVIETDAFLHGGMSPKQIEEFYERCKSTHPLGRIGRPQEIADAITFLASDRASFITGETLPVDGGKHALCPR